jgi:hypothetical protein
MLNFSLHTSLAGLVRRTWLVTAITVISCAAFAAHAATSIVTANYLTPATRGAPGPGQLAPLAPTARAAPPALHHRRGEAAQLAERNMFCSSCSASTVAAATGFVLPPAVLIATGIGGQRQATVHVLTSEVQGSWALGETIPGLGLLDRIGPTWIELVDGAGHRGRLSLLGIAETAVGRDPDPARSGDRPAADPGLDRVRPIDEQNYEVDRSLVRDLVTGAAKPGGVRFVPKLDHGEVKGVRVFGVTPGSIPFALGLKNGDTLEAIDGAPLKDLNQLLDLYARLDQLSAVELSGTRAGRPLVRTLRLR